MMDWLNNSKIISVGDELLLIRVLLKCCNTRKLTSFFSACSQPTAIMSENTNNLWERHCLKGSVCQSIFLTPRWLYIVSAISFMRNGQPCAMMTTLLFWDWKLQHPKTPERRKKSMISWCSDWSQGNPQPLGPALHKVGYMTSIVWSCFPSRC